MEETQKTTPIKLTAVMAIEGQIRIVGSVVQVSESEARMLLSRDKAIQPTPDDLMAKRCTVRLINECIVLGAMRRAGSLVSVTKAEADELLKQQRAEARRINV